MTQTSGGSVRGRSPGSIVTGVAERIKNTFQLFMAIVLEAATKWHRTVPDTLSNLMSEKTG